MQSFIGTLYDALTLGSIYALIAVGYTMVYGIIKLINFAHGEIIMIGTFVTLLLTARLTATMGTAGIGVALLAAMACCAMLGLMLDWVAYLPLRRSKRMSDTLSAFSIVGVALLAIFYFLTKETSSPLYSPLNKRVAIVLLFIAPGVLSALALIDHVHIWERPQRVVVTDRLNALIVAIGMSLYLQAMAQLIWGAGFYAFPASDLPGFLNADVPGTSIAGVALQGKQLSVWVITLALMLGLAFLVNKTRIGLAMRASALDKNTAALMGVNVDRVIIVTFMIGSMLAAVAGVMYTVKAGGNISYRMGYYLGVLAFAAAVLGGIGNIHGAVVGGLLIGMSQAFGVTYVSSELDIVFAFGIMVLVIMFRPRGLFGQAEATRA